MTIIEERPPAGASSPAATTTHGAAGRHIDPAVAGWFDDPKAQHRMRYFDGEDWTAHVTHFGPTPCSGCG
jgi:hypothetical protein